MSSLDKIEHEGNNSTSRDTLEKPCKMTSLETVGGESKILATSRNSSEKPYEMSALDTVCDLKTVDTIREVNTLETPVQITNLETICEVKTLEKVAEEQSSTVPLSTLDTPFDLNTVETPFELNTVETAAGDSSSTVRINTFNKTCEMNTLDTACEMNTLDTACEMKTLDTACEMKTLDTACEMKTLDTACEMKTLDTACEMKTLDTACEMETLNTACEMNTLDTACEMNTMEVVADGGDSAVSMNTSDAVCETSTLKTMTTVEKAAESICSVKNVVETVQNGETSTSSDRKKAATAAPSDDEPLHKKAKLELNESVKDSHKISSQSISPIKESTTNDTNSKHDGETTVSSLHYTDVTSESTPTLHKPRDVAVCSKAMVDGHEKQVPLTEIQAGITEYLGSHKGFSAVIKQRYSDFIVNEIDVQGNVVRLTQVDPPEIPSEEPALEAEQGVEISPDIVSSEDKAKLESLVKNGNKKELVNIVAPEDKDSRTRIHLAIKKKYPQIETRTAEVDGQKMIQALWKTGNPRDRKEDNWPESKKDCKYVKFVLYKENKDTMDAVGLIAKNLRVKEGLFQYAGTKDKRAKTSQEITAYRIHPKKLHFMNKVLWNMGLGNFQYVKEPLKLGQLSGNQFTIVLRNVEETIETVDAAMSSLQTQGFVNYFGMQRFGTTVVPTHKVGRALLHGDWEKAVDLILMPRNDNPSKDAFQRVWMETKDPEATLKVTPPYCGLERNLLEALRKKLKPFNAIEKISRNTRMLYVHSYQALIWNQMVSRRLKVFGFKPVIGDLVMADVSENTERSPPVFVTQENLDQYSLHQVILPLPGYDVVYPKNDVHGWYREMLAADGLDIDNMRRPQKDYSLPGAYRHITVCPTGVSWTHHRYDDYSMALTLSDLDAIKGEKLPAAQNKGKFKAVVLKLTLPSSTYATMALREVLRVDTSVAHQTSLNVT